MKQSSPSSTPANATAKTSAERREYDLRTHDRRAYHPPQNPARRTSHTAKAAAVGDEYKRRTECRPLRADEIARKYVAP